MKLKKFLILLSILIAYFFYLSLKFGAATGGIVAFLTWSFFVLCTPVADAGFLLDFPLRFFLGIRMIISEIFIWILAILGNVFAILFAAEQYKKTFLTSIFHKILLTPNPYWAIIFLSMIGTFLSIKFGDDIYDEVSHKSHETRKRHFKIKFWGFLTLFLSVILIYHNLLKSLGIEL